MKDVESLCAVNDPKILERFTMRPGSLFVRRVPGLSYLNDDEEIGAESLSQRIMTGGTGDLLKRAVRIAESITP